MHLIECTLIIQTGIHRYTQRLMHILVQYILSLFLCLISIPNLLVQVIFLLEILIEHIRTVYV